jgi:hypothetical protein
MARAGPSKAAKKPSPAVELPAVKADELATDQRAEPLQRLAPGGVAELSRFRRRADDVREGSASPKAPAPGTDNQHYARRETFQRTRQEGEDKAPLMLAIPVHRLVQNRLVEP